MSHQDTCPAEECKPEGILKYSSSATTTTTTTTATTELQLHFGTQESPPLLTDLTLRSLAAAPMPAIHQSQAQQSPPSQDLLDLHSSSSRLSRPSKLSDENLQRQSTGIKERVKRSVKMRETEQWARQTSLQHSNASSSLPTLRSHPLEETHPSCILASPSPETLPRPRLSLQPVPSFRAVPTTESGAASVIISEHATINDWQSENTNNIPSSSYHPSRTVFPLSPIDVQFIGQTPTSLEFQSFNQFIPPGTVIGSFEERGSMLTSHIIPIQIPFSSLPSPSDHRHSQSSPRIREIPLTPPAQLSKDISSDPLLRARINLQQALSSTPQARPSPTSSENPETSPVAHYHPKPVFQTNIDHDMDQDEDEDEDDQQDNESGLSPIKEDRTAELAAEHSWKIKQMAGSPALCHHSLNRPIHQLKSSTSINPLDPAQNHQNHHQKSKSDSSTVSTELLQQKSQTSIHPEPATSQTTLESNINAFKEPTQSNLSNDNSDSSPKVIASVICHHGENLVQKDLLTGSPEIHDERNGHQSPYPPVLSFEGVVSRQPTPPIPKETHSDPIPASPPKSSTPVAPQTLQPINPCNQQTLSSRRNTSPLRLRTGLHKRPNPPLSVPASAHRPPPEDMLSRLEMEEWRNQTGIDDRYSLLIRPTTSSFATAGSLSMNTTLDFDRAELVGLGGEERRGIKDRWGNSWGLESHILSPLTEHTEFTTVGSILSLSTRKSNHSLKSLDSTSTPIAQRLEQADSNSMRILKLGTSLVPSGVITHVSNRSVSCPVNRIDSPTKLTPLNNRTETNNEPSSTSSPQQLLLEEKLKRKEFRRLKRERIEKRRAQEILSSESLALKQERRRQEKKKKEEFLEKKHQILSRLQESGPDAKLIRDLGILYMTSNVGVAGLQLAIRHLETSLQMDDTDALAWSCLGKTWSYLHDVPEAEITNKINNNGNFPAVTKTQQAHNATIGLRKAIINSKTYEEVIKYKIQWARFLEKVNKWRDSLGLISELLKNFGKSDFTSWANLGFIGLRIIFGWSPLKNLETDDLDQGFTPNSHNQDNDDQNLINLFKNANVLASNLSDSDRLKLLIQVHNAFQRAIIILDEQIVSNHLTQVHNVNNNHNNQAHNILPLDYLDHLKTHKSHYLLQLNKVDIIRKHLDVQQQQEQDDTNNPSTPTDLIRDHAPHQSLNSTKEEEAPGGNKFDSQNHVENTSGSTDDSCEKPPSVLPEIPAVGNDTTQPVSLKDDDGGEDLVTQEIRECSSTGNLSNSSTPSRSTLPIFSDSFNLQSNLEKGSENQHLRDVSDIPTLTPTANNQVEHPSYRLTAEKNLGSSILPATSTHNQQEQEDNSNESLHLPSSNELILSTTDVDASSDGPEVIVQYDDVDTTNDYSEHSKFSDDPFRPNPPPLVSSHHQLGGHPLVVTSDPILNPKSHELDSHPVVHHRSLCTLQNRNPDLKSCLPSQQSDSLPHNHNNNQEIQSKLPSESNLHNVLEQSSPKPQQHLVSSSSAHPQMHAVLPRENVDESVTSPCTSLPIPQDNESIIIKKSSHTFDEHSILNNSNSSDQITEEKQRDKNNLIGADKLFDCDISSSHLHRKISKLDLTSPDRRKLKGTDKEKLIAFLELDNEYHSKISKLRKKLIKIEEEREATRKEMFERVGIKQIYYHDDDHEQPGSQVDESSSCEDEDDDGDDHERRSIIRKGLGLAEESNQEERASLVERKKDQCHRLGLSFSSVRSTSSAPARAKFHFDRHHPQHPPPTNTQDSNQGFVSGISRSVCSPIPRNVKHKMHGLREGRRTFSLHDHPSLNESVDPHSINNNNVSCTSNSTVVNDPNSILLNHHLSSSETAAPIPIPGSSDSNQANIALQGIAAILKLATSTQAN